MSINKKIKYATRFLPDKMYIQLYYFLKFKKKCDLKNPKTFNEKLQWIKLYDRNPQYIKMVDKYEAKNYVSRIIGAEYIIPTLGRWDKFKEIDFKSLPDQFVLKCTHDSNCTIICKDKKNFDFAKAEKRLTESLSFNYYYVGREWPYKYVKPRIIAEKYMNISNGTERNNKEDGLIDYKFYCFNGIPKFLYISQGLDHHETARISFVTLDWEFAPFERKDYKPFTILPPKPKNFDSMIEISKKLSKGHRFLRVDLYEIDEQVYFSELTFTPCSGMMLFKNPKDDEKLGHLLELSENI